MSNQQPNDFGEGYQTGTISNSKYYAEGILARSQKEVDEPNFSKKKLTEEALSHRSIRFQNHPSEPVVN